MSIIEPGPGPCEPWATLEQYGACHPVTEENTALVTDALDAASDLLYARSARRFPGICTDSVMPAGACGGLIAVLPNGAAMIGLTSIEHRHVGACCAGGSMVELGSYPVRSVEEVRVDGVVLAPELWTVIDWKWLIRTDGGTWPCCNNPAEDPPHLEVDFTFGQEPPASGRLAVIGLASELAKACGGEECALDRRVQTLSREGVTITIPGLVDTLKEGRTGIPEVDMFLWAHNPNGLQRRGRLLIFGGGDVGAPHRRTLPAGP